MLETPLDPEKRYMFAEMPHGVMVSILSEPNQSPCLPQYTATSNKMFFHAMHFKVVVRAGANGAAVVLALVRRYVGGAHKNGHLIRKIMYHL